MAVPDFQSIMRPTLVALSDGHARSQSQLRELLAEAMGVTAEERELLLPSGKQAMFANRVGWAITYLVKTALLDRPQRGLAQITDRGRVVLAANPDRVDLLVLSQFPELAEFRDGSSHPAPMPGSSSQVIAASQSDVLSPTESIAELTLEANSTVAGEVLAVSSHG